MGRKRNSRELKNNQVIDIETARKDRREKRVQTNLKRIKKDKDIKEGLSRRRTAKIHRRRLIYSSIFIIICIIIGMSVLHVISLKTEEALAQRELDKLYQEKDKLENELSTVDSPEYIEQQARTELRMIYPGETLYIIKDEDKDAGED